MQKLYFYYFVLMHMCLARINAFPVEIAVSQLFKQQQSPDIAHKLCLQKCTRYLKWETLFSECQYQTLTIDSYFRHLVLFGCATVSTANDATWSVSKHSGNIKLFFLKKYTHFFEKMYAKNSSLELTRFR